MGSPEEANHLQHQQDDEADTGGGRRHDRRRLLRRHLHLGRHLHLRCDSNYNYNRRASWKLYNHHYYYYYDNNHCFFWKYYYWFWYYDNYPSSILNYIYSGTYYNYIYYAVGGGLTYRLLSGNHKILINVWPDQ